MDDRLKGVVFVWIFPIIGTGILGALIGDNDKK